jgi:hypothetical protein
MPIFIDTSETFDRIAFRTFTTWSAAGNVRMGVYNNDSTTMKPSTVKFDAGVVVASAVATIYNITISQTLDTGWYWLAICLQSNISGNAQSGRVVTFPGFQRQGSGTPQPNSWIDGWSQASVAGAFATAGTLVEASNLPAVMIRNS